MYSELATSQGIDHMGTLNVLVSTDGGISFISVFSLSGNQGNNWIPTTIDLSNFDGQNVIIRFEGIKGFSSQNPTFQSDISLDEISITSDDNPNAITEGFSFENSLDGWTNATNDDFDWTNDNNGTSSAGTGPSNASEGSYYMYTEATGIASGASAFLDRAFDFSGKINSRLLFDFHMYAERAITTGVDHMGTLNVLVSSNNGVNFTNVFSISGNQGNRWIPTTIDLSSFDGQNIIIRFEGIKGFSTDNPTFQSDIAIDNVIVANEAGNPIDTDGDNIPDNIDIDDDNEGILDVIECPEEQILTVGISEEFSSTANQVGNCGSGFQQSIWFFGPASFKIGAPNDNCFDPNDSSATITDYTTGSTTSGTVLGIQGGATPSGESSFISVIKFNQEVVTNTEYELSFAAMIWGRANLSEDLRGEVQVFVNGDPDPVRTFRGGVGLRFGEWEPFLVNLNSGSNTNIEIDIQIKRGSTSSGNDYMFDDIIFKQKGVEIILDRDNDGINNCVDLDSDNDGIPDNIEAQSTIDYIPPSYTNYTSTGLDGIYESTNGVAPIDTDQDNTSDYLDLDSDGDADTNGNGEIDDFTKTDLAESGLIELYPGLDEDNDGQTNGALGENGLNNRLENTDDFSDVNAGINNPATDLRDQEDGDVLTVGDVDYRDIHVSGTPIISQILQTPTNRVIEITNIDTEHSILANTIRLSLFIDLTGDLTDITPDETFTIPFVLAAGGSVLITNVGSTFSGIENAAITNFSNGDDTLLLTHPKSIVEENTYENRYETRFEILNNASYVRSDQVDETSKEFESSQWVTFVDENEEDRHPHAPLTSEIGLNANPDSNTSFGLHRTGPTSMVAGNWDNGFPDRTRRVIIPEDYISNNMLRARTLTISNGSKLLWITTY